MKSLLWTVLALALAANVLANVGLRQESTQMVLSITSGLIVLGSAAGLWRLRVRKDA
ncbi:hypothetical protein [Streptomyces sp. NPDC052042]|uniref:hypothetical protein n=1 Tax=Streptomyces sp. NPDC052042 TaxID=3365683 RepID=UPI0037D6CF22